ncbi:MAG TPA: 5-deoxy-glucuronate isomerase [Pseudonocardiaceae bacterium]|nr:5-deoxy-glucuronate isomerase [Pseudonocardiaceae bacterium]
MNVVDVTPESAGWTYCGLRVVDLAPGESVGFDTGSQETVVLPLSGGCVVTCGDAEFTLTGRADVFAGPSDFAYVPIGSTATVTTAGGGRFALPSARADKRLEPRYGPVDGVPVELRGAGRASRQVNNFCTPETFDADKLIAVEVLTPGGNWSSYPPHKHDEHTATERRLEEIYYFEISGAHGVGYQRVYTSGEGREIDVVREVRSGDVVLIPHGYHGPSMAPPGYHMYYLNVMAGPDSERVWLFSDDPRHAWIRDTWAAEEVDPRLPFTRS